MPMQDPRGLVRERVEVRNGARFGRFSRAPADFLDRTRRSARAISYLPRQMPSVGRPRERRRSKTSISATRNGYLSPRGHRSGAEHNQQVCGLNYRLRKIVNRRIAVGNLPAAMREDRRGQPEILKGDMSYRDCRRFTNGYAPIPGTRPSPWVVGKLRAGNILLNHPAWDTAAPFAATSSWGTAANLRVSRSEGDYRICLGPGSERDRGDRR
jgi:hypothetical protein